MLVLGSIYSGIQEEQIPDEGATTGYESGTEADSENERELATDVQAETGIETEEYQTGAGEIEENEVLTIEEISNTQSVASSTEE